ncbi:Dfp1/Him1, central region-domain-containing protein [Aspergillus welwitschiae]|uniref:Dfp1/Him1, central region-domain-containing protein n=1 Tax=Aspergillus welwitschiae TaxID=1341132 RepID=A0A3F3QBX7_9EURO|nr:Dfp1/Him1, central region-domain-containing protein [Aspergillus welwitschiae]RDH36276.1 Dfp1/Him1, central region-domain-containing protein [Aspergillus welwitschiae]
MAAVFVPPSPRSSLKMSTRRPLANVPNATNSPHRSGLVPAKRLRPTSNQIDIPYGQPPPKKQVVDGQEADARSPTRTRASAYQNTDSKLFLRRTNNAQPSAFERKLVAVRDKERQAQMKGTRHERPSAETLDSIRQWQRHYRKAFPQFVFYFDSIPEDVRSKSSRQVLALGAREEKFFSRLVTHVVTSRPIPPENGPTNAPEYNAESAEQAAADGSLQTVNPSLLEKCADTHLHMTLKNDARREQKGMDVLHRARQMGMKIWAIEKLQRMITAINDGDVGGHDGHATRNSNAAGGHARARGENDLSQVLQNELNGPSDRNPLSVLKELVMFKGPFIYVHDMDEKTRPVMVREYPKVARRQDGIWPQFRSARLGKCPFIEDPPTQKDIDRQRARIKERTERQERDERAVANAAPVQDVPDAKLNAPETHRKVTKHEDKTPELGQTEEAPLEPQPELQDIQSTKQLSPRKSSESFVPPPPQRKGPFFHGREPAASGVQPSNITSAIRSQMVSSTAAAPGAKAGLSKEVHELKRKVLEKGNGGLTAGTMPPSHHAVDGAAPLKAKPLENSLGNMQPPKKLVNVPEEESTQLENNGAPKRRAGDRKTVIIPKRKERRRDPKPGYCENCRDKFDDFEEHIVTRKHRRFATNRANWAELDALLYQLERPVKSGAEGVPGL